MVVKMFQKVHMVVRDIVAVSYTHLDVYKRQGSAQKTMVGRS